MLSTQFQNVIQAMQTILNIYDIQGQAVEKRLKEVKSVDDAQSLVGGRVRQFFVAIEAGYGSFPGPLFYGDRPSIVDFQLIGCVTTLNYMFGEQLVGAMLAESAPSVVMALAVMHARPNIKAFVDAGFKGESVMQSRLNLGAEALSTPAPLPEDRPIVASTENVTAAEGQNENDVKVE